MKTIAEPSVVLVCTDCDNTRILYNGVKDQVAISHIIIEPAVSRKLLVKRRIARQGWWKTIGQLLFQAGIVPVIKRLSRPKVKKILREKGLDTSPMPEGKIIRVPTVNSTEFIESIKTINPDIILVNGTRIIAASILSQVACPVINVHVGITPLYRGVHGAYWALANNDRQNCGVTIHVIDKGIDTGAILAQDLIKPNGDDNFITYPYLQFERAISLVKQVIPQVWNRAAVYQEPPAGKSKLWYHPTIWQYLNNRLKGVK